VLGDNPTSGLNVQPTSAQVTGADGGSVTLTIFGGKPDYSIAPTTYVDPATTATNLTIGVVTLNVPAGTGTGSVVYTITDSATPTPATVQFTLTIV
jgi:hypothetical protein